MDIAHSELVEPIASKLAGEENNLIVSDLAMVDNGDACALVSISSRSKDTQEHQQ